MIRWTFLFLKVEPEPDTCSQQCLCVTGTWHVHSSEVCCYELVSVRDKETAHFGKNNDLPTELTDHYPRISNSNHWLVTPRQWESVAVFTVNDEDLQTLEKKPACWLLQHSNRFWGWWHPLVSLSAVSSTNSLCKSCRWMLGWWSTASGCRLSAANDAVHCVHPNSLFLEASHLSINFCFVQVIIND